jgi:hypothetical protein
VVATGIEVREVRSESAATSAAAPAESKPVPAPSFRLRPQMPKLPSASLFPHKPVPAAGDQPKPMPVAASEPKRPPEADDGGAADDDPDRAAPPSAEPRLPELAASGGETGKPADRTFLHPPLPPQERFQEWGRLRAPVRELERAPSLFERVTASFGRQRVERPGEPMTVGPRAEPGEHRLAVAEDEPSYDIPAFLRR